MSSKAKLREVGIDDNSTIMDDNMIPAMLNESWWKEDFETDAERIEREKYLTKLRKLGSSFLYPERW